MCKSILKDYRFMHSIHFYKALSFNNSLYSDRRLIKFNIFFHVLFFCKYWQVSGQKEKGVDYLLIIITTSNLPGTLRCCTARKMKFSFQYFFSKCKQMRHYPCISSNLLKKCELMQIWTFHYMFVFIQK